MRKTIIIATIALFIGLGTTSCVTTRILALTAVEDFTVRPSLRSKAHYAAKHTAASHTAYNKPLTLT